MPVCIMGYMFDRLNRYIFIPEDEGEKVLVLVLRSCFFVVILSVLILLKCKWITAFVSQNNKWCSQKKSIQMWYPKVYTFIIFCVYFLTRKLHVMQSFKV